jgi:AcrR family transcriptional regulator
VAYEVTKRIGRGDYRYRVEGYRDSKTGRQRTRWQYLGRVVDGVIAATPTRRGERTTRENIVAATAQLLETREASRVTVDVIARHAGISQATFYRYFDHRKAAFTTALSYLCDRTIGALPSLEDHTIGTRADESSRILAWIESLHRSFLRQRAFRWSFAEGSRSKTKAQIERSMLKVDPRTILAAYLRRLDAAGVARIADADELASGIIGICSALIRSRVNEDEPQVSQSDQLLRVIFPLIERAVFGT